jgi:hypothetical protein
VTARHAPGVTGGAVVLKDHLIQVGWKQIAGDCSLEKLIPLVSGRRAQFNGAMDISNTVLSWMPIAVIAVAVYAVIRFALRLSRR